MKTHVRFLSPNDSTKLSAYKGRLPKFLLIIGLRNNCTKNLYNHTRVNICVVKIWLRLLTSELFHYSLNFVSFETLKNRGVRPRKNEYCAAPTFSFLWYMSRWSKRRFGWGILPSSSASSQLVWHRNPFVLRTYRRNRKGPGKKKNTVE